MAEPTRDDAWALVCEWIEADSLRKHVLGVEAAMRGYARRDGEDEERWGITGLVKDLDYDGYSDLDTGHPRYALKELEARGYPEEIVDAVAGHAEFMGVPRTTRLAKALYGVDELSGFVAACALVRPTGIDGMKPKSVRKKLQQPSFAAKVDRDQIRRGIEELGVDETEHIQLVIDAMAENASELGLEPQASAPEDGYRQRPPAFDHSSRGSTEQKSSGMRFSPRWRTRSTWTSPSSRPQCAQVRGPDSSAGGSSSSPASQCGPWIAHGMMCSRRQNTARRDPAGSYSRKPSSSSTLAPHQVQLSIATP